MGILIWLAETIFGTALKGLFSRFFPSVDERLGIAEQKDKDYEKTLQAIQDSQREKADVASLSDAAVADELHQWTAPDK